MSPPEPRVSIILPTLDADRYLREAVDSCLSQSLADLELLVIDGGSSDATLEILASYDDPRLCVIHQADNVDRLPGALNLGLQHAAGAYLTWMQADCILGPDAIQHLETALDAEPDLDFVYSNFWVIDGDGCRVTHKQVEPPERLVDYNCVGHFYLWRSALSDRLGGFDPAAYLVEDWEYWMRVARWGKLRPVPDTPSGYFLYREHEGALTSSGYIRISRQRIALGYLRRHLGLPFWDYWRRKAGSYVEEAFEAHRRADRPHMRRSILLGVAMWPVSVLCNRGVAALLWRAIVRPRSQA